MPRPRRHDKENIAAAARALAPEVLRWLNDKFTDLEDVVGDLEKAMRWGRSNGYEITRELEDHHGYDPDSELVEIVDNAFYEIGKAHEARVAEWVAAEGIKPRLAVGHVLAFQGDPAAEIRAIDEKHATYTVMLPSEGHVREGTGTHGQILPFEEVEAAALTEAA